MIDLDQIIIDLKTGVSGAGRSAKENLLHAELSEGFHAYAVGGQHRHLAEFDQEFSALAGRPVTVQFTPHFCQPTAAYWRRSMCRVERMRFMCPGGGLCS